MCIPAVHASSSVTQYAAGNLFHVFVSLLVCCVGQPAACFRVLNHGLAGGQGGAGASAAALLQAGRHSNPTLTT
jgi:hypothetical protein